MQDFATAGPRPLLQGLNLVWTMVLQNFSPRTRRDTGRIVWVFLEPIGLTAVTAIVFALINRGVPYGPSLSLFLASGIVMLTFFRQGTQAVMTAVVGAAAPGRLALIGVFHEAMAQIIFRLITKFFYFFFLLYAIAWFDDLTSLKIDFVAIIVALLWCALFTFGWGLVVGYCIHMFPFIERAYGIATAAMVFISSIFFVPSFIPPPFREWLAWNPVLQLIERMRLGLYADYPTSVYDETFLEMTALGATALGVVLIWFRRARLLG